MADPIHVTNPASQLEGKTLLTAEDFQAVSGQKTFNRAPSAPFEVQSGSAAVANLDADKLDGEHGADYHNASLLATGTVPGDRLPNPLPAVSAENLNNLPAPNLTGAIPATAVPDPLPAVSGANLTHLPAANLEGGPLPALSGANLTALPNPLPAVSGANLTALPNPLPASSAENLTNLMMLLKGFAYSSGQGNAAGGGDTQLTSYDVTIPAGFLSQPGDALTLVGLFALAANTNPKTVKLKIGPGTLTTVFYNAANVAAHYVPFRLFVIRRSPTVAVITGLFWHGATNQGAPSNYLVNVAMPSVDWSIAQTLAIYAAATLANDIKLTEYFVNVSRGLNGVTV